MKKFLGGLLIILGLAFISLPFISKTIVGKNTQDALKYLDDLEVEDLRANEDLESSFDFSLIRSIDIDFILKNTNDNYKKAVVGHILINEININLPILKGTTDPHLMVGATTMKPDQVMGKGNYPLAGHQMIDKSKLFGKLLDIKKGHIVKITNKETIYEYEIYDIQIVPDTSLHLLEDKIAEKRGKPVISLMTCYYTDNDRRFFVFGELVDEYPFDPSKL